MLRIGDFARLAGLSTRTLRLYAEQGLLTPEMVDPATGYRYYALQQLVQLNRILALKDLGFSLNEIQALLAAPVDVDDLRRLLAQKRAEMDQLVRATQDRLARVESRLRQLEAMEANMANYDVVLKPITPLPFSPECEACQEMRAIRAGETLPDPPGTFRIKIDKEAVPDRFKDDRMLYLRGASSDAPLPGPPGTPGFPPSFSPSDELVMLPFIEEHVQPDAEWGVQVVHVGDKDSVFAAHVTLVKWIEQNGYVAVGHVQQTVLQSGEASVIEIIIPIKRAS